MDSIKSPSGTDVWSSCWSFFLVVSLSTLFCLLGRIFSPYFAEMLGWAPNSITRFVYSTNFQTLIVVLLVYLPWRCDGRLLMVMVLVLRFLSSALQPQGILESSLQFGVCVGLLLLAIPICLLLTHRLNIRHWVVISLVWIPTGVFAVQILLSLLPAGNTRQVLIDTLALLFFVFTLFELSLCYSLDAEAVATNQKKESWVQRAYALASLSFCMTEMHLLSNSDQLVGYRSDLWLCWATLAGWATSLVGSLK